MQKQELRKMEDSLNRLFSQPQFHALLPQPPNMRYYQAKGESYAFCWTTEPTTRDRKFHACIYRVLRNGNWKLKKSVSFRRRKVAKARALKWFNQRKEKTKNAVC